MMPETLQSSDERRLLDCIKKAVDLVDNHAQTPDQAIEKVAREEQFAPGMIGLVARAYNNGRQLGQWRANTSILDKLASYELADPDRIVAAIYPKADQPVAAATKTAFDRDYLLPPSWLPDYRRQELLRSDLTKTAAAKCGGCGKATSDCTCRKMAADVGEPADRLRKAYGCWERVKNGHEQARQHQHELEDNLLKKVAELTGYFRQPTYTRLPFEQVDFAARRYLGPAATDLLKVAYVRAHLREKQAMTDAEVVACKKIPAVYKLACDRTAAPYTIIVSAIGLAEDILQARQWVKEAEELRDRVAGVTLHPFVNPSSSHASNYSRRTPGNLLDGRSEKTATLNPMKLGIEAAVIGAGDVMGGSYLHRKQQEEANEAREETYSGALGDDRMDAIREIARQEKAVLSKKNKKEKKGSCESIIKEGFLGSMFGSSMGRGLARGLGDMPKTKGDLIDDDWLELEDPRHLNEMRKIRTNAMLAGLLTDPDDPISGHDPDKVLSAYNEIAAAAPRVADSPASLKPVLRKRLAGHTEPFEAHELINMEKGLRDIKNVPPSTHKLTEAPENMLG